MTIDAELLALRALVRALRPLDPEARVRVLVWLHARFVTDKPAGPAEPEAKT